MGAARLVGDPRPFGVYGLDEATDEQGTAVATLRGALDLPELRVRPGAGDGPVEAQGPRPRREGQELDSVLPYRKNSMASSTSRTAP